MAKTEGSEKPENEIALSTQTGGELSTEVNFFEGAGDGHSDFGATDFTIPYIGILQALSKPLIKGNEKYIKGAEQGMFINSATRQIYSGEDGIVVIPVLFRHRYQAWKPNNGGIAYDMGQDSTLYDSLPESQEEKSKGKRFDQHGNEVVNSMEYIVLIIDPKTGVFEQAVIPFSGVFAKKAKRWNNLIRGKVELHKGKAVRPAIFFYAYKITTVPETNDRGSWYSHNVENFAKVPELPFGADLFKAAGMLRQSVLAGEVQTASEAPGDGGLDTEHNAF